MCTYGGMLGTRPKILVISLIINKNWGNEKKEKWDLEIFEFRNKLELQFRKKRIVIADMACTQSRFCSNVCGFFNILYQLKTTAFTTFSNKYPYPEKQRVAFSSVGIGVILFYSSPSPHFMKNKNKNKNKVWERAPKSIDTLSWKQEKNDPIRRGQPTRIYM